MKFTKHTIDSDIHIIDGLFSHKEISDLQLYAENKPNYTLCGDQDKRIFTFAATDVFKNFDSVQLKILSKFKSFCNELGIDDTPEFSRVITNCFGINDFCDIHTDSPYEGNVTFLLYCNKEWHTHWSGETYFQREKESIYSISILPSPGRLVITPTEIWHGSRAPTQFMRSKGRITMAFQSEKFENALWYNSNREKLING